MTLSSKAREAALRLLRVRPRTRKELYRRLKAKGFSEDEIQETLKALSESGLLDEREFAEAFALGKIRRLYSREWIAHALLHAGISEELANEVLNETYCEEEVYRHLVAYALRIAHNVSDREKAKRRIYTYILRRGHPSSTAYQILKEVFGT